MSQFTFKMSFPLPIYSVKSEPIRFKIEGRALTAPSLHELKDTFLQ